MSTFFNRISVFWNQKDLIKQLVQKDIKLKYRRSFLGYLWSVLNPLLVMIVMAVVFSRVFHNDIEHYPVYLFTGQILFNFMSHAASDAINSITGNAALLKKTYVPKYIFTFSKITSNLIDLLFSLVALVVVMLATGKTFAWTNLFLLFPIIQLYLFTVGLGMLLAALNVYFRDIQYIWNAFVTAWMYATPIFYSTEIMGGGPVPWIIEHLNPMYFYIRQFRDLVYSGVLPGAGVIAEGILAALAMLIIGTGVFWKLQDDFILYI